MSLRAITKRRIRRIFDEIDSDGKIREKPSYIFVRNGEEPYIDYSFFYITDYTYGLFEGSMLSVSRDNGCAVVTSPLEEPIARKFSKDIDIVVPKHRETPEGVAEKSLRGLSGGKVGVDFTRVTQRDFVWLKNRMKPKSIVDVSSSLERTRLIKDEVEISRIKVAASIASKAFRELVNEIRPGMTENEVAAFLNYSMQKRGSSGTAFETISSSGPNSAEPHYSSGPRKLRPRDSLVLDYGAKVKRYNSDITRTLIGRKASKKIRIMYEVVSRAQAAALDAVSSGVKASDVDRAARKIIDSSDFKGKFTHGVGHSLGLAVHDGFGLGERNGKPLENNMVLTIEPGIYVEGLGGVRIEDDVIVTPRRVKVITSARKELIEF